MMWEVNERKLRLWRRDIKREAEKHRVSSIRQEPLRVRMTLYLPMPKGASQEQWAPVAPDIDKLTRAVLDGCTDGKVFVDDAQVVELIVRKRYGWPGVRVTITKAGHWYRSERQEHQAQESTQ